jgi:beta-lactamase class A
VIVGLMLAALAAPVPLLEAQMAEAARAAKGSVGAVVVLLETGQRAALHASQPFPMQSVYKLPIAMAVMQQVDAGRRALHDVVHVPQGEMVPMAAHSPLRDAHPEGADVDVRELLRLALAESDGTASDVLLRLAGGPAAVNAMLARLGVRGMTVATTETAMTRGPRVQYRNASTPDAALALLRALHEGRGLRPESRALILETMTASTPGPRRLKGLLPAGTAVAHKTGTSGTRDGVTAATNDIGIVTLPDGRHLAIAVFVRDSRADEATREGVIARIARAAWDEWTGADRARGRH